MFKSFLHLVAFSSKEAVMRESSQASRSSRNKLWSSVMANAPPSTWQHENLEGVIKYGTTIRRQPTKAKFKGIKKLLFTSRKLTSLPGRHFSQGHAYRDGDRLFTELGVELSLS